MTSDLRDDLLDLSNENIKQPLQVGLRERGASNRSETLALFAAYNRSKTNPLRTLPGFYEVFQRLITASEIEDGLSENYRLQFVEAYPPQTDEDIKLPCLTAKLLSRSHWPPKRNNFKPILMETVDDPDQPGEKLEVYYKQYVNEVEITVWSLTNKVANRLADWVEDKFMQNGWIFEAGGFGMPIRYLGRWGDETEESQTRGNLIHGRPLRFSVITGKITKRSMAAMRRVGLHVGLLKSEEDQVLMDLTEQEG